MSRPRSIFWDSFEDEQIKLGYELGEKVYSIAHRLHRNYGQIAGRARQLGVRHKLTKNFEQAVNAHHLPAMRPIDEALGLHCLNLFRHERLDTAAIGKRIARHESEVLRMLHHAREAERT